MHVACFPVGGVVYSHSREDRAGAGTVLALPTRLTTNPTSASSSIAGGASDALGHGGGACLGKPVWCVFQVGGLARLSEFKRKIQPLVNEGERQAHLCVGLPINDVQ